MIETRPLRYIIERGTNSKGANIWVAYRTDDTGMRYHITEGAWRKCLAEVLKYLANQMLLRNCEICGVSYFPRSSVGRICRNHTKAQKKRLWYLLGKQAQHKPLNDNTYKKRKQANGRKKTTGSDAIERTSQTRRNKQDQSKPTAVVIGRNNNAICEQRHSSHTARLGQIKETLEARQESPQPQDARSNSCASQTDLNLHAVKGVTEGVKVKFRCKYCGLVKEAVQPAPNFCDDCTKKINRDAAPKDTTYTPKPLNTWAYRAYLEGRSKIMEHGRVVPTK